MIGLSVACECVAASGEAKSENELNWGPTLSFGLAGPLPKHEEEPKGAGWRGRITLE